jgi:hypothetical protein
MHTSTKEKPVECSATETSSEICVRDAIQNSLANADMNIDNVLANAGVSYESRRDLRTMAYAAVFYLNGNPDAALSTILLGDGRMSKFIAKSIVRSEVAAENFGARVERGLKKLVRLS